MTTNRPGHPWVPGSGAGGNDDVLRRAMTALGGNRPNEAEQIARDVLNTDRRNAKALYVLGSALLMQGRPQDAIAPLEDAARGRHDGQSDTMLAIALRQAGRAEDAYSRLKRTTKRQPPYAAAFLELGRSEDAGVWAPLVRITGTRAASDVQGAMATAAYTWLTVAADVCLIQASLTHGLWIRPCARVSGGVVGGSATVGGQPLGSHDPWVTAGLLGRLQWRPAGPLFFEAQGGAAYVFTHDPLSLAPASSGLPVLQPAPFEPFGAIGVGLTFP